MTRQNKTHYGTVLPIALMAFAIVGFLLLVWLAIEPSREGVYTNTVACTQEAKLCPDGSYVGRTGVNCAFAECPGKIVNANVNVNSTLVTTELEYREIDDGDGFCATIEIFSHDNGQVQKRLRICEDNVAGFDNGDDNGTLSLSTSCGNIYTWQLSTGAENIMRASHCPPSLMIITDPTAGLPAGQAGWKTYENSAYSYSFRYPSNWTKVDEDRPGNYEYFSSRPTSTRSTIGTDDLWLTIAAQTDRGLTLEQYANEHTLNPLGTTDTERQSVTIDGQSATRQYEQVKDNERQGEWQDVIYVKYNDRLYILQFISNSQATLTDGADLLGSILSTFKFTQ